MPGDDLRRPSPTHRQVEYRRITRALAAAGLASFAAMYSTQAILPELSDDFAAAPATAALSVSVTTGAIAFAIIPMSALSERFGRIRLMVGASIAFVLIGLLLPLAPTLATLLVGRGLQGVALAGVPAVAMAYLAEEVDPRALGAAMGQYIAGTTVGGLLGRLIPGLVVDVASWRWALAVVSVVIAALAGYFCLRVPPSRNFHTQPITLRASLSHLREHLRDRRLLCLFVAAFVLMGGFVTAYNYLGYRLIEAPFDLPRAAVGAVFLLYLAGTVSSAVAGRLADRHGRAGVMAAMIALAAAGLGLTALDHLLAVVFGMVAFTAGFFGAHSVASGWVGVIATVHRAEASSLYLFAYYLGSSVLGALGGLAYAAWGWGGIATYVGIGLAIGMATVGMLFRDARTAR